MTQVQCGEKVILYGEGRCSEFEVNLFNEKAYHFLKRESFQPAHIDPAHLKEAQEMAEKVTRALTGAGLWGVEFFLR